MPAEFKIVLTDESGGATPRPSAPPPPLPSDMGPPVRDESLPAEPAWDKVHPKPRDESLPTEPAWDKIKPPTAMPVGPAPGTSSVPAFDRPQPVVVMGPKPLPVEVVGGLDAGGRNPAAKEAKGPKPESVAKGIQSGFNLAGQFARAEGAAGAAIARNGGVAALEAGAGAAGAALSRLGPYGMAAAAALQAGTSGVKAFTEVVEAFVARGRELSKYNAQLAMSSARADIRQIEANMGEANRIGPQLSKLIDAQSKAEASMQRLLEPIRGFIAEKLTESIDNGLKLLLGILEGINKLLPARFKALEDLIADIKKILSGGPGDLDKLADAWIHAADGLAAPPPVPAFGLPAVPGAR